MTKGCNVFGKSKGFKYKFVCQNPGASNKEQEKKSKEFLYLPRYFPASLSRLDTGTENELIELIYRYVWMGRARKNLM